MNKIERIQQWLQDNNYDIAYLNDPISVNYFTGYQTDPIERVLGLFVFPNADPFLFVPQLEVEASKKAGWNKEVYGYLDHEDPFKIISKHIMERLDLAPKNWAIEKFSLPVSRMESILVHFPDSQFVGDVSKYMEKTKLIKTPEEIALLQAAGKEADYAFSLGFQAIKEGKTEQEVVAEIEYGLMKKGVMHTSFDTIVQGGANAANPHGGPEKTPLKRDELILFDLGTVHQGYMSDASRTVAFGKPSAKSLEIYKVCLEAQLTAQAAVKPGITAAEIDKIARDIIKKAGYGEYFIHRTGHGIGTSDHEFPSIMEGNDLVLQPGMCFSIEPGIYIPGVAGVRIEDCVAVTETSSLSFTSTSKELTYID
ncbi:Xaa-Pro aminopeptidase [Companilactobacillus sp. RD055328]|uniref:M24 family metallopeptidase n=1 Tax=Companilactobacillus sp. RD055328 TaxID=2916634 RepID=UPI001FC8D6FF|nr:Xaa-Pro peptidase family protein [Companilactobacillus sp. RD055328]GKQ42089.1 Xaa-Pro aminopeptidase [Companilactobacillus sp. RD055328]